MGRPRSAASGTHLTILSFAWILALLVCVLPITVKGLCTNACSGHGLCDRYKVCRCYDGFSGHDCSQRPCPLGKAWGIVSGVNAAHSPAECSGRGTCELSTGICRCQQGFTGSACELVECPESCLARGKCITMQEHAQSQVISRELYDAAPFQYVAAWDSDVMRGCRCDTGYSSPSCGVKRCPVGDDPLTTDQLNEVQLIECMTSYTQQRLTLRADASPTKGTFLLVFGRQYTRPISFQALAMLDSAGTSVASALQALTGVTSVTATRSDTSATHVDWSITFPTSNPTQNAIVPKWKVEEVQQFICAADAGTFAFTLADTTVRDIPFNSDLNTFINALGTIPFVGTISVAFADGATTVCSSTGTFVTMRFVELWRRDLFGDIPAITFSMLDTKGLVGLFLQGVDGFIDTETKEVVKGVDSCRVVEQQRIECAATSGRFALTFEDGTRVTDIPFSVSAGQLRAGIIGSVPYIVDLDVNYSAGNSAACTTEGNLITLSFVVVRSTGAMGDGDLAEVLADGTNGGVDALSHNSNRLRLAATFTELVRGVQCVALDQTFTPDPVNQIATTIVTGGGSFTVSFRGATSSPIPANSPPEQIKAMLESMPPIQGVDVAHTGAQACESPANVMRITFTQNFGNLPTVVVDGTALVAGSSIRSVGGGQSLGALASIDGTKESNTCSNRGICDESILGRCYCFLGYTSSAGRTGGGINTALVNRGDCGATSRIPVACPGDLACSGHGACSGFPSYRCTCAKGWRTGDCSERLCPTGLAWFDYPSANNVAHTRLRECSDVGACDRSNGVCKCPRPYTGTACELMICGGASECSGNGQCLTLNDLAPLVAVRGEIAGFSYGDDPNDPLTWDRGKIRSCLCDAGYFGYDCSLRECPRGDDPSTYDDVVERQLVHCVATSGSFTLTFRDQTTAEIPFSASSVDIKAALEAISSLREVTVTLVGGATACSAVGGTIMMVDLLSELGDLPAIKTSNTLLRDSVNGNGQDGSGSLTVTTGGTTLMGQASVKGTRENVFCSNHGKCDFSTGNCACDEQYGSSNGKGGPGTIGDCGYQFAPVVRADGE